MKLTVKSLGHFDSDNYGRIIVIVENDEFKGTAQFWANSDVFEEFAHKLAHFPFESKEPVVFEDDNVRLEVSLFDKLGKINMKFVLAGEEGDSLILNERSAEVGTLNRFAMELRSLDTSLAGEVTLET